MCFGGAPKPDKKAMLYQQAADMQRENNRIVAQNQQQERMDQQYAEQLAIQTAPPPPAPAESAATAAPALENAQATTPSGIRKGMGRRKLRTDVAGGTGGLSIPNV
jgi:hypothetical protein